MYKQSNELKTEINELKGKVVGLQSRLYQAEQKIKVSPDNCQD